MIDVNMGPALWLTPGGGAVHAGTRFGRHRAVAPPGIEPTAGMAAYGVSKAALVHLTRVLDLELRPHGIRVNAVAPHSSTPPGTGRPFPQICWRTRSHRRRSPTSIAFLVSDAAAPVSGALLPAYGA